MPSSFPQIAPWTLRLGAVALLVIVLFLPGQLLAQGHELRVTLHDTAGQGISDATIIVCDEDGHELARQSSDTQGFTTGHIYDEEGG